jgi:hypothetical protein
LRTSNECRCADSDVPLLYYAFETHSFEVDIISFDVCAGERPWTRKSTIRVKEVLKEDRVFWEMKIEMHTSLLAVHLIPVVSGGRWPDRELRVFDWKTGGEVAVRLVGIAKDECLTYITI